MPANLSGGEITSDAGVMLLHQVDKIINLTDRIATTANDPRNKKKLHTISGICFVNVFIAWHWDTKI